MLLQFHVTVVESLTVTTDPCVAHAAYSNSGQQRNHRGRGGGYHGAERGRGGVAACITYIYIYREREIDR